MPIEAELLRREPYALEMCPKCKTRFPEFMRGQVQRSKRFLWVLWRRPYCAVICHGCKEIVGWESPPKEADRGWRPRCAMVNASVARAMIRAMGMQAENEQRKYNGAPMAYSDEDFFRIIDDEAIGYNSVIKQILD